MDQPLSDIREAYSHDDIASVYAELKHGEAMIYRAAGEVFAMEENETRVADTYEQKKNKLLDEMFQEESAGTVKKRVESHRTAIYRIKLVKERLDWQLAKKDAAAQRSYLDALIQIQTSIEARAKLIALDARFAGNKYGT